MLCYVRGQRLIISVSSGNTQHHEYEWCMVVIIIEELFFQRWLLSRVEKELWPEYRLSSTLTIGATLGNRALTSTPPHGDTVDDVALRGKLKIQGMACIQGRKPFQKQIKCLTGLHHYWHCTSSKSQHVIINSNLLGLVSQPACLVRPGWPRSTVHLNNDNCTHWRDYF